MTSFAFCNKHFRHHAMWPTKFGVRSCRDFLSHSVIDVGHPVLFSGTLIFSSLLLWIYLLCPSFKEFLALRNSFAFFPDGGSVEMDSSCFLGEGGGGFSVYHLSQNYYITAPYFWTINFGHRNVIITSQKSSWNYFWAP